MDFNGYQGQPRKNVDRKGAARTLLRLAKADARAKIDETTGPRQIIY
jgi:hypothetical protein